MSLCQIYEVYDDKGICLVLGTGDCDHCPYGFNFPRREVPEEPVVKVNKSRSLDDELDDFIDRCYRMIDFE